MSSSMTSAKSQDTGGRVVSSLERQVGGTHYKDNIIQPIEFITKNGFGFSTGNVIKYVSRYEATNDLEDLDKAIHYLELMKEFHVRRD